MQNANVAVAANPAPANQEVGKVENLPAVQKPAAVNYTPDQFKAYLEYQRTGLATKTGSKTDRWFPQPVGETKFTAEDKDQLKAARKEHRQTVGKNKAIMLTELKAKKWLATADRLNKAGSKRVVRFENTDIAAPKKKN